VTSVHSICFEKFQLFHFIYRKQQEMVIFAYSSIFSPFMIFTLFFSKTSTFACPASTSPGGYHPYPARSRDDQ